MKVLIMGNSNGLGGAQTAFRKLVDFSLDESGVEAGVISITDQSDMPAHWNRLAAQWQLPFASDSFVAKTGKQARLLQIAVATRRFAPDVFVTVGLAQSANLIARFLPRKTFKVAQDFIHGRAANDPLLTTSAAVFDAIAAQAPAMVDALRQNGFDARPVTWLPCFPEPPVAGVVHEPRRERPALRFAYFGRLAANKGLVMLVNALQRASFSVPVGGLGNDMSWNLTGLVEDVTPGIHTLDMHFGFIQIVPQQSTVRISSLYQITVNPVPEPAGLALVLTALGLSSMTCRGGRRRVARHGS